MHEVIVDKSNKLHLSTVTDVVGAFTTNIVKKIEGWCESWCKKDYESLFEMILVFLSIFMQNH